MFERQQRKAKKWAEDLLAKVIGGVIVLGLLSQCFGGDDDDDKKRSNNVDTFSSTYTAPSPPPPSPIAPPTQQQLAPTQVQPSPEEQIAEYRRRNGYNRQQAVKEETRVYSYQAYRGDSVSNYTPSRSKKRSRRRRR